MSCNIDIDLKLNIHDAALIRSALFQHTKQDSYEFPSARTVIKDNGLSGTVSKTGSRVYLKVKQKQSLIRSITILHLT